MQLQRRRNFRPQEDGHNRRLLQAWEGGHPVRSGVRPQEDGHDRRVLQAREGPLELVQPAALQYKLQEPIRLLGKDHFADVDICIRVKDGYR